MADEPETDVRDRGLHRHGDPDPSQWDEQEAVTGRPQDEAELTSTFASRRAAREAAERAAEKKAVDADGVEDKAAKPAATKRASRRRS